MRSNPQKKNKTVTGYRDKQLAPDERTGDYKTKAATVSLAFNRPLKGI